MTDLEIVLSFLSFDEVLSLKSVPYGMLCDAIVKLIGGHSNRIREAIGGRFSRQSSYDNLHAYLYHQGIRTGNDGVDLCDGFESFSDRVIRMNCFTYDVYVRLLRR